MTVLRRSTIQVHVGPVGIGSDFPIRVQSMTTTNTLDTQATVAQSIRLIESGCELVRITAPSQREAKNLAAIKKELVERGYNTPLVADIHYTPNAAEIAARIVEKVRINPGNYVDKKTFAIVEYTNESYQAELDKIRDRFIPLVRVCKEYGTAMRIGTNHGSLSDRIVNRYGDNPEGMVQSALEFLSIAESEGYRNIVVSMKSSNPIVMVEAYRLFVKRCSEAGLPPYPLHLGVTEAGDGEDGRVKSAVGIGTLLTEGLGDTIRVSLTEEPEAEIPVARALAERYRNHTTTPVNHIPHTAQQPTSYRKRRTHAVANIGHDHPPRVVVDCGGLRITTKEDLLSLGHQYDAKTDKWHSTDQPAEYLYIGSSPLPFPPPSGIRTLADYSTWKDLPDKLYNVPVFTPGEFSVAETRHPAMNVLRVNAAELESCSPSLFAASTVLWLVATEHDFTASMRRCAAWLQQHSCVVPVLMQRIPSDSVHADSQAHLLRTASDFGSVLVDGFGNGLITPPTDAYHVGDELRLAYGILQAARMRMTKTEYISCPSCGRTLFDLQETTSRIRAATDHLKGVKIGIMGCIVNGPGEMADADYGYVGSGPDKVTLYRGQEIVRRGIPTAQALEALIDIMREDGRWIEKGQVT